RRQDHIPPPRNYSGELLRLSSETYTLSGRRGTRSVRRDRPRRPAASVTPGGAHAGWAAHGKDVTRHDRWVSPRRRAWAAVRLCRRAVPRRQSAHGRRGSATADPLGAGAANGRRPCAALPGAGAGALGDRAALALRRLGAAQRGADRRLRRHKAPTTARRD